MSGGLSLTGPLKRLRLPAPQAFHRLCALEPWQLGGGPELQMALRGCRGP